jgi:hypothetical protein
VYRNKFAFVNSTFEKEKDADPLYGCLFFSDRINTRGLVLGFTILQVG